MARVAEAPHLSFPLRLTAAGTASVDEQDTLADVTGRVRVLLRTGRGARPLAPLVGVPDPTFTLGVNTDQLEAALTDSEHGDPRAQVTVTTTPVQAGGVQHVQVRVDLVDDLAGIDAPTT